MLVVPAGLAFAKAIGKRPDMEFYQPDKRHPSAFGTYLRCMHDLCSDLRKVAGGHCFKALGVDEKIADFLQSVAWETVQEYSRALTRRRGPAFTL